MAVILDVREKDPFTRKHCDELMLLDYDEGENGIAYSYDVHIVCDDGKTEFRGERKTWEDFIATFHNNDLPRQLRPVDFVIIESDEMEIAMGAPDQERDPKAYEKYVTFHDSAKKHRARLAFSLPVIPSSGPKETMLIYRYIEKRGHMEDFEIRENKIRTEGDSVRWRILNSIPGVNPYRRLPDGRLVGEVIEDLVDWDALLEALHVQEWVDAKIRIQHKAPALAKKHLTLKGQYVRKPLGSTRPKFYPPLKTGVGKVPPPGQVAPRARGSTVPAPPKRSRSSSGER